MEQYSGPSRHHHRDDPGVFKRIEKAQPCELQRCRLDSACSQLEHAGVQAGH